MLCQNCGKNEVNFRYTQIINGEKKEMALCDKCAKELGLEGLDFSMPINFSSFFSDFFNDYTEGLLPSFANVKAFECDKCGMTFDDFANTGEFGCDNCYITFADRLLPVLKKIHGSNKHIGREYKESIDELEDNKKRFESAQKNKSNKNESKKTEKEIKLKNLQKDLQKAIKDERYEDAAKIRDEIKKINEKENK